MLLEVVSFRLQIKTANRANTLLKILEQINEQSDYSERHYQEQPYWLVGPSIGNAFFKLDETMIFMDFERLDSAK